MSLACENGFPGKCEKAKNPEWANKKVTCAQGVRATPCHSCHLPVGTLVPLYAPLGHAVAHVSHPTSWFLTSEAFVRLRKESLTPCVSQTCSCENCETLSSVLVYVAGPCKSS